MERSEMNGDQKMEEMMLPGFRFHPTDEELVGFYLKRKVQERPVSIELIKPLDIYKHDPWDLPKLVATTGEKEWYFYCRRDRKYQNSARPNRVTGGGFWKATGTDRPIYSSDGSKCIGLKKSLVFYKGRAAKGFKTDWMMHEFRLPSSAHHKGPAKRVLEKSIPPHELWAICRIFKKPSSSAQRGFSHSCVSPILPKHPSPVLPQCGNDFDHFDHTLFNIDTKSPILTTNNNKPPLTFISSNQDSAHLISVLEPDYTIDTTSSLVFNMPPSVISDFDEGLDYMTNDEHQYFNDNCFSLDNVPVIMQDEDQEHMTKVTFTSPVDIVHFNNQWSFSDFNNVI